MGMTEAGGNEGMFFFSILNGYLKRTVPEHEEGAVERINSEGKKVFEKFYKEISGMLVDIQKREHESYGDSWIITLEDVADTCKLQIPYSSIQSDRFFRRLHNVDVNKPISIRCGRVDDKPFLVVDQDGKPLDYYWTKDDPKHLPPMVQKTVKGKLVWDDTDRMAYIEMYLEKKFMPRLKSNSPNPQNPTNPQNPMVPEESYPIPDVPPRADSPVNRPGPPPPPPFPEDDDMPF